MAEPFRVSVSYLCKALGRRAATGEVESWPQRNHQELKLGAHHDAIMVEVAQRPDVTLNELRTWLLATHGVGASPVSFADIPPGDRAEPDGLMHRTLARLGLTPKKVDPGSARTGEPDRAG